MDREQRRGAFVVLAIVLGGFAFLGMLAVVARARGVEAGEPPAHRVTSPANTQEPVKPPQQSVWHAPAHHPVALKDLLSEYKANEIRADNTYKFKLVELSGVAGNISKSVLGGSYIVIQTHAGLQVPAVQCFLKSGEQEKASRYSKGDQITVRGKVTGLMMNVSVRDCEIL